MMEDSRRSPIPEKDRIKLLLWCDRHCCFCGKQCTTNIEIHHVDGNPSNSEIDNLIPLCFDCHGEVARYNPEHPVGMNYRSPEIRRRRDQIYDLHTLPYLRKVDIRVSNYVHGTTNKRPLGDVSCTVRNMGQDLPAKVGLHIRIYHGETEVVGDLGDLYSGSALWNLNPSFGVAGHFPLQDFSDDVPFYYRVEVFWSIVDILEREHRMLPVSWVWDDLEGDWWLDPRVVHNDP